MTFSGEFDIRKLIKYVNELLYKEGFRLNKSKIKVVLNTTRQQVTGIVVNEKINLSKNYKRKIRQEVYYVLKYGVKSHIKKRNIRNGRKIDKYLDKFSFITFCMFLLLFLIIITNIITFYNLIDIYN